MKVLLTGPCGRHGFKTLLRLLDEGHDVRAFDTPDAFPGHPKEYHEKILRYVRNKGYELDWQWGDIRDEEAVRKAVSDDVDAIIHHAAMTLPSQCEEEWEYCWNVNYYGTRNVIDAIQRSRREPKLLYSSSVAIYGFPVEDKEDFSEGDLLPSTCTYAATKIASELAIERSGINYTIMRMATVGEPGVPEIMLVAHSPALQERLAIENRLKRTDSPCHMVAAHDVDTAYLNALDNPASDRQAFNIAGPASCRTTFKTHYDEMQIALGGRATTDDAWGKNRYPQMYYDIARSSQVLDYAKTEFDGIFANVRAMPEQIEEYIELSK